MLFFVIIEKPTICICKRVSMCGRWHINLCAFVCVCVCQYVVQASCSRNPLTFLMWTIHFKFMDIICPKPIQINVALRRRASFVSICIPFCTNARARYDDTTGLLQITHEITYPIYIYIYAGKHIKHQLLHMREPSIIAPHKTHTIALRLSTKKRNSSAVAYRASKNCNNNKAARIEWYPPPPKPHHPYRGCPGQCGFRSVYRGAEQIYIFQNLLVFFFCLVGLIKTKTKHHLPNLLCCAIHTPHTHRVALAEVLTTTTTTHATTTDIYIYMGYIWQRVGAARASKLPKLSASVDQSVAA